MTVLARAAARALERGVIDGPVARLAGQVFGALAARAYERPLLVPAGVHVIGVGGSTLGGSWKTPCAIALAQELRAAGEDVVFVGHGHRGSVRVARLVHTDDSAADVGDEAVVALRALRDRRVRVVVGGEIAARLKVATRWGDVIVVDGLAGRARDGRQHRVLALDAEAPWGSGSCPPAGDLRAPMETILGASDSVVVVGDALGPEISSTPGRHIARFDISIPAALRDARVALVTAIARPDRLLRALGRRGIEPRETHELPDHGDRRALARIERTLRARRGIDVIATTEKCAAHLGRRFAGLPVAVLELSVRLPESVIVEASTKRS